MSDTLSKFEELIGDVGAFRLMLDGAFKEWEGTYDVLSADTGEYLFRSKEEPHFQNFCRKLRSKPEGENLCWECDSDAATRSAQEGHPIIYPCHAGLIDVAAPIFVDEELVATVFCGQVRPKEKALDRDGFEKAQELEIELGFDAGELVSLWRQVPQISESEMNSTIDKVWKLVKYISELGHERLELQKAHQKDQLRLSESEALERVAKDLSGLAGDWGELWTKVNHVLERMRKVVGASCGMIMIPEGTASPSSKLVVKAVARLSTAHFEGRSYSLDDELFCKVVEEGEITLVPFREYRDPSTICGSIRQFVPLLAAELDEVVLVRVGLGDEQAGVLLFFLAREQDVSRSLPIEEEKGMLVHLASLIGTAYHNCSLYQARQREVILRRGWLRRVTHQLLAPLHGLQGYAEDAWRRWWRWQKKGPQDLASWTEDAMQRWESELRRWEYSFESIVWSSHYAARLASNLAWIVYADGQEGSQELDLDVVEDMGGLLIKCARDFQGIARERGLRKVEVNTQSVACLDGQVCVSDDLFRQAMGNLLDNAVKYSDRGTDILIEGGVVEERAEVRVINCGIRLYPGEVERIFEEGYRGREALSRHPTGTGIGLTVAGQIIELHGGELMVQPSKQASHDGWQTTFVISLPMHPERCP
jgi:signal transduction histidine kinase/ligand-binding sensor protein